MGDVFALYSMNTLGPGLQLKSDLNPEVKDYGKPEVGQILTTYNFFLWFLCVGGCVCLAAQSWLTLCCILDCSRPGSSVHGILQARILEQVAISFSRRSSQPRQRTRVSCVSCIADRFFTCWAIFDLLLTLRSVLLAPFQYAS